MKKTIAPASAIILALGAAPLAAQDNARNLDNAPSDVRIYADEMDSEAKRFDLSLGADEAMRITVSPAPGVRFDPYLKVYDRNTGELLKEDDDGGEGVSSQALLYSESRRDLRLEITRVGGSSGQNERFEIALRPSNYRPQPPRDLGKDSVETSYIAGDDGHLFRFSAERGEIWSFSMVSIGSSSIDPVLEVYPGYSPNGDALDSDDDGGDGRNSLLNFIAPEKGIYTLVARSLGNLEGNYRLSVNQSHAINLRSAEPKVLDLGASVNGMISGSDSPVYYRLSERAIADLRANPGALVVTMDAANGSEIDPKLELGFDIGTGFASLEEDDDGGENLNARLIADLFEVVQDDDMMQRLRIKAAVLSNGGSYTLRVGRAQY